jgi:hypothetical protein
MAIWPFNRNKQQPSDLPQEVQDYYQAEKREKVGIAGLLALGTLLGTIVVVLGLFFGGRWVYRTAFKDDKPAAPVQTGSTNNGAQPEEPAVQSEPSEPKPAAPKPKPSKPKRRTVAVQPRVSRPEAGKSGLPSTGPEDNWAIVASVAIVASGIYYVYGDRSKVRV